MKPLIVNVTAARNSGSRPKELNKIITASEAAVALGISKYKTRYMLWAEKTGKFVSEGGVDNAQMALGRDWEGGILNRAEQLLGKTIIRPDTLYAHDKYPWIAATPDGLMDEIIPVEAKMVNYKMRKEWEGKIPTEYHLQNMIQIAVCGAEKGVVTPLIGGDAEGMEPRWLEYDEEFFQQILEGLGEFLWYVKNEKEPPATGLDLKIVNKVNVPETEEVITISGLEFDLINYRYHEEERKKAETIVKHHQSKVDEIKAMIAQKMGNARHGICGDYEMKRTLVRRAGFTVAPSEYVTMTVKEKEND